MVRGVNPFGDWRSAQHCAETHICTNCRHTSALAARWWHGGIEVYCPRCGEMEHLEAVESLTSLWRRDPDSVPLTVANRLERMHRRKASRTE